MRRTHRALLICLAAFLCGVLSTSCSGPRERNPKRTFAVSVGVSRVVVGEVAKLMMKLNSANWHERFVAALELRERGIDEGIRVLKVGLSAEEWFVRVDALRFVVACEAVNLISEVIVTLSDINRLVSSEADRTLAALVCVYPDYENSDRARAWKKWHKSNPVIDRMSLIREAMIFVEEGLIHKEPGKRYEALMVLRGLRIADKTDKYARALNDADMRVSLLALEQLSVLCSTDAYNDSVTPILKHADAEVRAAAAFYLAERGGGEELAWQLHEALLLPGRTEKAHALLIKIFEEGPAFEKPKDKLMPEDYWNAWKQWLLTDEVLKGKRDWQKLPTASPAKTAKPDSRPTIKP